MATSPFSEILIYSVDSSTKPGLGFVMHLTYEVVASIGSHSIPSSKIVYYVVSATKLSP